MNVDWTRLTPLLRIVLILGGFVALVIAAWGWDYRAGLAALGVSLLVFDFLVWGGGDGSRRAQS